MSQYRNNIIYQGTISIIDCAEKGALLITKQGAV